MNYYTMVTAQEVIPDVQVKDYNELTEKLEGTGLEAELYNCQGKDKNQKGDLYIFGEESFDEELFVESGAVECIGRILKKSKKDYLQLGLAFYGDRARPGTCDGTAIRITANGDLIWSERVWPEKHKKQKVWVLSDADLSTCEVFANRKDGETWGKTNFEGTTLQRVKSTETVFLDENGEVVAVLIQKTMQ